MWLGLAMMAAAFFSLLAALSIYDVSFVVPVTALSYVAGAFGSAAFLREHVNADRWLGVALVVIGVTLVFLEKAESSASWTLSNPRASLSATNGSWFCLPPPFS